MSNERTREGVGVLSTLWNIIGKDSEEIENNPELDADKLAADVMSRINHKPKTKSNNKNTDVGGTQKIKSPEKEKIERERE